MGPASDVGTDYILLERAGIIKVEESTTNSGRYNMTLVKDDTARIVREVLAQGTVSGLKEDVSVLHPSSMTIPGE